MNQTLYIKLFLFLILQRSEYIIIEEINRQNNNADHYKDTKHSDAHVLQSAGESGNIDIYVLRNLLSSCRCVCGKYAKHIHEFKHHNSLPLHKEVEDKTARDNGCDLTGNVNAYGVHKQEVLRIFLKSHLMNYTS